MTRTPFSGLTSKCPPSFHSITSVRRALLAVLHIQEEASMSNGPTEIDRAPVLAHYEIDIEAPLDRVWGLHTDVASWPKWQKEIAEAQIDGPFEPGTSFDWTSYGFPVTSTIYDVDDRSHSLWGGTAQGITGIHEWLFTRTPSGVRVETNESFAGDPVEADAATMQSMLDASLAASLGHLKSAAESKSA
jgi:hypothetical protein